MHAKINKSVDSITEYKNKWSDVHNKLTSDYEDLLRVDNEKDAFILKLKAEISGLKNQLDEMTSVLQSIDAKNQNYRDLTLQIHQLRQDLAQEKYNYKEIERTHLSSCDEFNRKLEKSNDAYNQLVKQLNALKSDNVQLEQYNSELNTTISKKKTINNNLINDIAKLKSDLELANNN